MNKLTISPDAVMTEDMLGKYIRRRRADMESKKILMDYYLGSVLVDKGRVPEGRPDNQAYTNLAKYIVDTATGYFVGAPPVYTFYSDAWRAFFVNAFDLNDEPTINYTIAENMSIYGVGYDLVWLDENARIRLKDIDPLNAFLIYADTIGEEILYGVRYYSVTTDDFNREIRGELYDKDTIKYFKLEGGTPRITEEAPNYFGAPPITEYPNNRHYLGDFEAVLKNIDNYNLTLSNATDDLQSVANAYLAIVGMMGTKQEDIDEMNRTRVALLAENGQMEFITKNLDSTAMENHKKTLRQDVLQIAGVPDLADEFFSGNASGVALRYKMWALDQLFSKKSAYMERGLFRRLGVIARAKRIKDISLGEEDVSEMVSVKFTQNMPKDTAEKVDTAIKLSGIVSNKTVFEVLEPATEVSAADEEARVSEEEVLRVKEEPIEEDEL